MDDRSIGSPDCRVKDYTFEESDKSFGILNCYNCCSCCWGKVVVHTSDASYLQLYCNIFIDLFII